MLDQYAPMTDDAMALLGQAVTELGLSARAYDKLRRVSRTIADIDECDTASAAHIAEAVQYRLLDRPMWGLA
jgi:magnesium chelatase family protein